MAQRVVHVTSRDNPLLVRLRRLARHPAEHRRTGEVVLAGEHLCQAWRDRGQGRASHALIDASAWSHRSQAAVDLADDAEAVIVLPDALLAEVTMLESAPSVAFVVSLPPAPVVAARTPSVVLDRIQDAGNVGSILRSASAFGHTQVIAMKGTVALWSPKVLRAAMGAHFALALVESADASALDALAIPLVGTSSHARAALDSADLPSPCAWLFGNEGAGVSAALASRCEMSVRIDQPNGEESINVAVAAGICLHASRRPR